MAFIPSYNRTKVAVGVVAMFIGPYSATAPLALPASTVPLGGAWPVGWVAIGATEEGVTENFQRSTQEIMIEEQATAVFKNTDKIDWNYEVTLSEDTLETMKLGFGGGTIVVTPPGVGTPGTRKLIIATDMDQLCLGWEGQNPNGYWTRARVPLITSEGNISKKNRRAADARRYSCKFNVLCAPEEVEIVEMNAAAL